MVAALSVLRRRDPRRPSAAPATDMSRRPRRCRTTTPPIPACSGCSTARRCGSAKAGAADKACADCHGDARTSMKGVAARYPAFDTRSAARRSGAAHQLCRTERQKATPLAVREPRAAGADRLRRAAVARRCRSSRRRPAARSPSSPGAARCSAAPGPAQSRLRAMPRRQLGQAARRHRRSRRGTRPAIRSTGWNGKRWARCSGGCATA